LSFKHFKTRFNAALSSKIDQNKLQSFLTQNPNDTIAKKWVTADWSMKPRLGKEMVLRMDFQGALKQVAEDFLIKNQTEFQVILRKFEELQEFHKQCEQVNQKYKIDPSVMDKYQAVIEAHKVLTAKSAWESIGEKIDRFKKNRQPLQGYNSLYDMFTKRIAVMKQEEMDAVIARNNAEEIAKYQEENLSRGEKKAFAKKLKNHVAAIAKENDANKNEAVVQLSSGDMNENRIFVADKSKTEKHSAVKLIAQEKNDANKMGAVVDQPAEESNEKEKVAWLHAEFAKLCDIMLWKPRPEVARIAS